MQSGDQILDNLWNGLSSIYSNDNGMLNSNLNIVLGSYAKVFNNVQNNLNQVSENTYISTADDSALEANFGTLINFPKPPQLSTLSQGDDIYRAMLKAMFRTFLSGSTTASMQQALGIVVSYLTTDPNTTPVEEVNNYTTLFATSSGITLAWPAVQASGDNILGPARTGTAASGDIAFFPADLIVTNYNPATQVISFTGTVNTGTNYQIVYTRDNTAYNGTNWINLTNPTGIGINPLNLNGPQISNYDNPVFSYWWNTYNADGNGIVIDQAPLSGTDSSLVWRLPEKTIQYLSPYSQEVITQTIDFYNSSGTAYDITKVTPSNPDILFNDVPINYYDDVSSNFSNYYIRYSANNNSTAIALSQFLGSLPLFTKYYNSIVFPSANFGPLDFFEMNSNFNVNDLFGSGTTNVWLDVQNTNGAYTLNNDNILQRNYSLHEDILFFENFEGGQLSRISSTNWTGTRLTDVVGVPLYPKNDCLMLFGQASGVAISASPILGSAAINEGNHVEIDFYDGLNSGTQTLIDVVQTGTSGQYNRLRFGIDQNVEINSLNPFIASQGYGFVETYFASTDSTNSALTLTGPYTYSTGTNQNVNFSNMSLVPTGSLVLIPNATPSLVSNADTLLVQFNNFASGSIVFTFSNVSPAGFAIGGVEQYQVTESKLFGEGTQWVGQGEGLIVLNPGGPHNPPSYFFDGGAGQIGIPYTSGIHTVMIRNGAITIDGVSKSSVQWNNLGTYGPNNTNTVVGPLSSCNIGSPFAVQVAVTSGLSIQHFEFGNSALRTQYYNSFSTGTSTLPYFYQSFNASGQSVSPKIYLNQVPREEGWHTFTMDFTPTYTGNVASIDAYQFLNTSIPFSGNIASTSGISMITNTIYPLQEYSYFDNVKVSYYDASQTLPIYDVSINLENDWEGSALSQSTILDNKFFQLDPQPNFQFDVTIQGLNPEFVFIINNIIERLKPAHTIATSIFEQNQTLETSAQIPVISNTGTNWETGNIQNNIIVEITGQTVIPPNGLPVYITISGT